jgi:hypothetical protein
LDLIKAAIVRLLYHYPNSGINPKAMEVIAEDWHMDFNHAKISPEMFARMTVLARRRCKFFPTEADMLDCMKEIKGMDTQRSNVVMLTEPETMTDEQSEIGLARIRMAISLVNSGISPDEAAERMKAYIGMGQDENAN